MTPVATAPGREVLMTATRPEGFLAIPASGVGPGVLVLHAWWGLNDTFKSICSRLADAGFTAFAPDLFHGQTAQTIPDAKALANSLDDDRANAEVLQAATYLRSSPEVST